MKYAQLVIGAAGTGKSTYCAAIQEHCSAKGRTVRVGNLDPAAEAFKYDVAFDVRDLISVDDVMTEMGFGPNGALVFCMEYVVEHGEWLAEALEGFAEDDYLVLDCPGQVELYSHIPVMRTVVGALRAAGFNVCGVYCLDASFVTDASKLIAGNLAALAAMVHLELPHINALTKADLVDRAALERFLSPSGDELAAELSARTPARWRRLNVALARLLDDYGMVSFVPVAAGDEDALETLLLHVDHAIQYGEDAEPREPRDMDGGDDGGGGGGDDDDGGADGGGDGGDRYDRAARGAIAEDAADGFG